MYFTIYNATTDNNKFLKENTEKKKKNPSQNQKPQKIYQTTKVNLKNVNR